jgi:hypothetical protein
VWNIWIARRSSSTGFSLCAFIVSDAEAK